MDMMPTFKNLRIYLYEKKNSFPMNLKYKIRTNEWNSTLAGLRTSIIKNHLKTVDVV